MKQQNENQKVKDKCEVREKLWKKKYKKKQKQLSKIYCFNIIVSIFSD
jgi:hypothetical protein